MTTQSMPAAALDPRTLLSIRGLRVDYEVKSPRLSRTPATVLRAVDGVDLDVHRGQALGLVGESGSGKSTVARCIVGLVRPTAGDITFDGHAMGDGRSREVARRVQIVFQDPYSSLNPRMTVATAIGEMLRVHRVVPRDRVDARIDELLEVVGLGRRMRNAYPRQLSGGQRQRVGIARALSLEPELLIADEPVSALDVSVQATILALLQDLRERLGLTLLLIAHDLAVVRQVCDRVAVMYLGRIVEEGPAESLFGDARHPYTRGLLRAVPSLRPGVRAEQVAVVGEPPSPYQLPSGCRFHPRCPIARARCAVVSPDLSLGDHRAACHFAWVPPAPTDGGLLSGVPPVHEVVP